MRVFKLLNGATATGAGTAVNSVAFAGLDSNKTVQVSGKTTSAAGAATVAIEVSNNGRVWLTLATVTLVLGTTETTDGFASDAPWCFVRANVTAISGTGASVTAEMGA